MIIIQVLCPSFFSHKQYILLFITILYATAALSLFCSLLSFSSGLVTFTSGLGGLWGLASAWREIEPDKIFSPLLQKYWKLGRKITILFLFHHINMQLKMDHYVDFSSPSISSRLTPLHLTGPETFLGCSTKGKVISRTKGSLFICVFISFWSFSLNSLFIFPFSVCRGKGKERCKHSTFLWRGHT